MRIEDFEYMRFAKTEGGRGTYRFTNSGMPDLRWEDLGLDAARLALQPDALDPPRRLGALIAARYGVPFEDVFITASTSYANAMAIAGSLEPGDEALVETPHYTALEHLVRLAGGTVRFLPRRFEAGYAVDPAELRALLGPRTRLVVLTNPHNPSGVRMDDALLDACAAEAERVNARLFIDEVYLDFFPGARTAFQSGGNRVTVSGLTKAYGLGGLRIGWMFAPPPVRERARRLNDLLIVNPPWPSGAIAEAVLENPAPFEARMAAVHAGPRARIAAFFSGRDDLECVLPSHGILCFPRLRGIADAGPFRERLLRDFDVNVTPGRFFGAPAHFRLGFARDPERLDEGLARLGRALDQEHRAPRV